jgi:hypothetical protein
MTLNLIQALCVRENVIRLRFDVPLYFSAVLDPGDASDLARYAIEPDETSRDGLGVVPRPVWPARAQLYSPLEVDLWGDRRFSSFPSRYTVQVNGLRTEDLSEGLGTSSAVMIAVRAGLPPPRVDLSISNADLANPQSLSTIPAGLTPTEDLLGTIPVDSTGDLAHDDGLVSYTKRVLRRLSTKKGKYPHIREYGVNFPQSVKTLARAGTLASLAADAASQIREEPETQSASVQVIQQGGVAYFKIRIRCALSATPIDLLSPIQFTG